MSAPTLTDEYVLESFAQSTRRKRHGVEGELSRPMGCVRSSQGEGKRKLECTGSGGVFPPWWQPGNGESEAGECATSSVSERPGFIPALSRGPLLHKFQNAPTLLHLSLGFSSLLAAPLQAEITGPATWKLPGPHPRKRCCNTIRWTAPRV